jgi:hypothetical protein
VVAKKEQGENRATVTKMLNSFRYRRQSAKASHDDKQDFHPTYPRFFMRISRSL